MPHIDPHHSRPIDVHRWSDHPEVNTLVGEVWEEVFGREVEERARPGPKFGCGPVSVVRAKLTLAAIGPMAA